MSQNQSYFWQTTRHNVYLKRSAKWHMLIALMIAITFSTVCADEFQEPNINDNVAVQKGVQTNVGDSPMLDREIELSSTQHKLADDHLEAKKKAGFIDAFTASISVILLTELGDKTFFIAAIMAMRHPRLIVFGGAIAALALMTVLSCVFGWAANFIPKVYTYYISTALFIIFGLKMLYEGFKMKPTDAQEELEEVQTDLRKREDELLRKSARGKYEDADGKRKNSNSDKEDAADQALIHGNARNSGTSNTSEMQHRQRKQRSNNYNNNNTSTTSTNKQTSCDKTGSDNDFNAQHDSEVFLKEDGRVVEQLKMSTFLNNSPAHSGSIASNQTEQTICASPRNNLIANGEKCNNTAATDGSAIAGGSAPLAGHDSLHSLNGSCSSSLAAEPNAAGSANGSLKRLDRDVKGALLHDPEQGIRRQSKRLTATYFTMRIFAQAFTMTFLAEWGDRSQLTTIILAASKDVYGVITGGVIGHCICTGLAVIGGRLVASKISVRTVTVVGGIVFIGFAAYALLMPPDDLYD
ncbi:uncharacterized protein LOC115625590 isoform X1 [Scaptodrosophila lebanonensis]|uniref:Uncharacterized protein LOC115625590 isoform X1 n=1 Tax=Drosophila lebanonensis TaxID=7225 RepID=A0A6J2TIR4_DROLE|nr:uncharacterized protein LOC115625590 isoform X1 [Scaptodrosophila lebanonensis]XP_030376565.1 uncharacterized protein LOC115625590 isoform X1 [Scaptodrosophila lebanonensis]XP_030376566.1 uncharacterized protein LOC115625590 isoform X1 [Scaptodrosophila lebanonensis]XP_030376567.1 uncharacterized protein LOC115625590 isoform X1 [Scaptodrosophila lebanonensis]